MSIFTSKHKALPKCLTDSTDYLMTNEEYLNGLFGRLIFIDQLSNEMFTVDSKNDFIFHVDGIELNAGLCLRIGDDEEYSWWISNSQWSERGRNISSNFKGRIEYVDFSSKDSLLLNNETKMADWIKDAGIVLKNLLDSFFHSKNIENCISTLIAINSFVAFIVFSISRQRLVNSSLFSSSS